MSAPDDRPRWARIAHAGCLLELAGLACLCTWKTVSREEPGTPWALWFPLLCSIALVGLWRRVAWGRLLFSVISVLIALMATALLLPDWDDAYHGSFVEHLWGGRPPLTLWWLSIVVAVALSLAPGVAIGWRKHWFRSRPW